jgi:hypothetical protein
MTCEWSPVMNNHKDLKVWQKGVELWVICHDVTSRFFREEQFELASQMPRAAISIASDIGEGATCTTLRSKNDKPQCRKVRFTRNRVNQLSAYKRMPVTTT